MGKPTILLKRIYDEPASTDGVRFLVDRLWPRGISKERARLDAWLKEVAPSDELRRRYHHQAELWTEFRKQYFKQLDANPKALNPVCEALKRGPVTLLFAAKDPELNNAAALRDYLLEHLTN
jgi:uncharacterized protein YeaO (DUF488 family)